MSIAELTFRLPDDVEVVPDPDGGEVLVTRRGTRHPPQVLSADSWALLQQFRTPATLTAAIQGHCAEYGRDPLTTLEEAFGVLVALSHHDLLVPDGEQATAVAPRLTSRQTVGPATITAPIRVLHDSELWWARLADGTTAVVKVVDDPGLGPGLFVREVTALRRLAGAPAPDLLWQQDAPGGGTLVLSCAEGDPIDLVALDDRGRRHPQAALRLVLGLLDAYAAVHARGVLHGDVHPGNVLADRDGRIHLLDFGLAAVAGSGLGPPPRTGGGEQLDPQMAAALLHETPLPDLDLATEVYSLACLAYRVFTGQAHLDLAVERNEALEQIATAPPRPFTELGRPPWPTVEAVLARGLAHDPARRPTSVRRFRQELSRAALQ